MLLWIITTEYFENHMKPVTKLRGCSEKQFFNIEAGGDYRNSRVLEIMNSCRIMSIRPLMSYASLVCSNFVVRDPRTLVWSALQGDGGRLASLHRNNCESLER